MGSAVFFNVKMRLRTPKLQRVPCHFGICFSGSRKYAQVVSVRVPRGLAGVRIRRRTVGICVCRERGEATAHFPRLENEPLFSHPDHTALTTRGNFTILERPPDAKVIVGQLYVADVFLQSGTLRWSRGILCVSFSSDTTIKRRRSLIPIARRDQGVAWWCAEGIASAPMVWIWALHICQCVESAVARSRPLDEDRLVDGRVPRLIGSGEVRCGVYVGNVVVLSTDATWVSDALRSAALASHGVNLGVHSLELASEDCQALCLQYSGGYLAVGKRRQWRLRLSIEEIMRRGQLSGEQMELLPDHAVWSAVVRREALSVFSRSCVFSVQRREPPCPLWDSVRQELAMLASLVPFLQARLGRRWDHICIATDASELGFGNCYTELGADLGADMGRCSERWRFEAESAVNARQHALALAASQGYLLVDPATLKDIVGARLQEPDTADILS